MSSGADSFSSEDSESIDDTMELEELNDSDTLL